MQDHLPCVEVAPDRAATGSVVLLHGLGASGHDFEPIVPHLGTRGVRFVFPHAPEQPVTINGGSVMPSWYDIKSLGRGADREDAADIRSSAVEVVKLLDREIARGVPADRIVLAGFSQGGAMAAYVGHRYPHRLAGILVLSAYVVLADVFSAEGHPANADTPVLVMHGTHDEVVPVAGGQQVAQVFGRPGRDVRYQSYRMGHEVRPEQIADIAAWLRERLSA